MDTMFTLMQAWINLLIIKKKMWTLSLSSNDFKVNFLPVGNNKMVIEVWKRCGHCNFECEYKAEIFMIS